MLFTPAKQLNTETLKPSFATSRFLATYCDDKDAKILAASNRR